MDSRLSLEVLRQEPDLPYYLWETFLKLSDEAESVGEKQYRDFQRTLPRGLWYVVRYTTFDGDVLNGGIRQFFYSHTPREVCETLEVLERTGLTESADVLRQEMSIYKTKYDWPADWDERWLYSWDFEDSELDRLDTARCNDESSRRDWVLLDHFLREHLEECFPAD
jgi:hypothetical protein